MCLVAMVTDAASPGFRITILKQHTYAVTSCSQVTDLNQPHDFHPHPRSTEHSTRPSVPAALPVNGAPKPRASQEETRQPRLELLPSLYPAPFSQGYQPEFLDFPRLGTSHRAKAISVIASTPIPSMPATAHPPAPRLAPAVQQRMARSLSAAGLFYGTPSPGTAYSSLDRGLLQASCRHT